MTYLLFSLLTTVLRISRHDCVILTTWSLGCPPFRPEFYKRPHWINQAPILNGHIPVWFICTKGFHTTIQAAIPSIKKRGEGRRRRGWWILAHENLCVSRASQRKCLIGCLKIAMQVKNQKNPTHSMTSQGETIGTITHHDITIEKGNIVRERAISLCNICTHDDAWRWSDKAT